VTVETAGSVSTALASFATLGAGPILARGLSLIVPLTEIRSVDPIVCLLSACLLALPYVTDRRSALSSIPRCTSAGSPDMQSVCHVRRSWGSRSPRACGPSAHADRRSGAITAHKAGNRFMRLAGRGPHQYDALSVSLLGTHGMPDRATSDRQPPLTHAVQLTQARSVKGLSSRGGP